jgi:hypothetical protein
MRIAVMLIGVASLLATEGAACAEKFVVSTGPFFVQCTSTGQVCDPPQTLAIGDPSRRMKVKKFFYTASSAHCSAGRLLIDLDGVFVGRMKFVAGSEHATLRKRLRLEPGEHTLAFRFEGRVGGCNVGSVSSWAGEIAVRGKRRALAG